MPAGAAYYWITGVVGFALVLVFIVLLGMVASIVQSVWFIYSDSVNRAGFPVSSGVMSFFDRTIDLILTGIKFSTIIVFVGLIIYILVNSGRRDREEIIYG